jgi:hypothetical protein
MIIIGTTLAAFVMDKEESWSSWMRNAELVKEEYKKYNEEDAIKYFAAIQVDGRGVEPFKPFIERLEAIGGEYWTFMLDDGRTKVNMTNRLRHISFGQNVIVDYAQSHLDCTHLLYLGADCMPPDNIMEKMLEMNHPIVAPYIHTYNLKGPKVEGYPYPVMDAMATPACLLVSRDVFSKLRWRWDMDKNMSDDYCFHYDTKTYLEISTYVREDVTAKHYPEAIGAYEDRGYNLDVIR